MFKSVNEVINKNINYEIYRLHNSARTNHYSNIKKRMNTHATIICEGGWKYTGTITETNLSPFGKLQWLEIKTNKGRVQINANYIVSILRNDNNITNRKGIKGN